MLLIAAVAGLLFAQKPAKQQQQRSLEDRLTILETKTDSQFAQVNDHLRRIDERLDRLEKTQTDIQVQLATLNTKVSLGQWIGGTLGAAILLSLWVPFGKRLERQPLIRSGETRPSWYPKSRFSDDAGAPLAQRMPEDRIAKLIQAEVERQLKERRGG